MGGRIILSAPVCSLRYHLPIAEGGDMTYRHRLQREFQTIGVILLNMFVPLLLFVLLTGSTLLLIIWMGCCLIFSIGGILAGLIVAQWWPTPDNEKPLSFRADNPVTLYWRGGRWLAYHIQAHYHRV